MMNEPTQHESLSPEGQARRDVMLGELLADLSQVHRRRRRVRLGALSSVAAALILAAVLRVGLFEPAKLPIAANVDKDSATPIIAAPIDAGASAAAQPESGIVWISTDPAVLARMTSAPTPIVVYINDAELLQTLVHIGRPAGLIRFGDRLALSAPVTDEELFPTSREH